MYRATQSILVELKTQFRAVVDHWRWRSLRGQRRKDSSSLQFETLQPRQLLAADLLPFAPDDGVLYQIHGVNDRQGQLSQIDLIEKTFVDVGSNAGFKINGTGFRVDDGFIYGVKMNTDELIRLGKDGAHEVLGAIQDLPPGAYFTGDFGQDGLLYLRHGNKYFGVDVDTRAVQRVVTATQNVNKTYDIAYNPQTELHYSIRKVGQKAQFISIDLSPGSDQATINVINDDLRPVGTYGALFADAGGRVFAANNAGGLYEIDVETGVATFAGDTPRASSNDGALSAQAFVDLPPIALDSWISALPGSTTHPIPIEAPYDLEGQSLTITAQQLPSLGQLTHANGQVVAVGETLTVTELMDLVFAAPSVVDDVVEPVEFVYDVSDGTHTTQGLVEISFAGYSRVAGQVVVVDDTEESSFAGYAFNNEIRIHGQDFAGNAIDRTTTTDIHGRFEFQDLVAGLYHVEQLQPPIVFDSHTVVGNSGGTASANEVTDIQIGVSASAIDGIVFYEEAPAAISGFVYIDSNGNGTVNADESGLGNVTIQLSGTDQDGNLVNEVTTTDSYGFYQFNQLPVGNYNITQQQPVNYVSSSSSPGEWGGVAGPNSITDVALNAGDKALAYNFGEFEKGSLIGSVFIDHDIDNAYDIGDSGLSEQILQLTGIDFRGDTVTRVTTTDSDGHYRFDDLLAGNYQVDLTPSTTLNPPKAHVGIFNNDETVLDSNGNGQGATIADVEVGFGRHGRSFNFSYRLSYQFATEFDQTLTFFGTEGDDQFEFSAGELQHVVRLNGQEHLIDASLVSNVLFDGQDGLDSVTLIGSSEIEQTVTEGASARLRSQYWRVEVTQSENILVDGGGGFDRAFMYDTANDDRFKMTQDYTRMWNDEIVVETREFHRTYAHAIHGGEDRVYMYDSKYDDTIKMTSKNARMISRKFYNFAGGFERAYAYSVNGGNDRAQFWDSDLSGDVFQAKPEYSRMYNDTFYNIASGFQQIDAFSNRGGENDRAYLFGSEDDEILVAKVAKSGLAGSGFNFDVHRFERVYAYGQGGQDRAYLFDSKLDDRFVARPHAARLYNDHYYLRANDFDQVDAYSSKGGNDRAYFYDSEGDDVLITLEDETRLFGDQFDNTSHGFARTYSHATAGGHDQAFLYDSDQADTIKLNGDITKMYGDNYYSWMSSFEAVTPNQVTADRHDRALVFGSISQGTLEQTGQLADLIYNHASEFIYDVDAHQSNDDDSDSTVSMLDFLAGIDLDKD